MDGFVPNAHTAAGWPTRRAAVRRVRTRAPVSLSAAKSPAAAAARKPTAAAPRSRSRMSATFVDEQTKLDVKSKEVFMPALSSTMEEGKIVQWLKAPGEYVAQGEMIMVVESDKADMDVESFEEGYVAQLLVAEGDSAPVGSTVALLAEKEEDIEKVINCGTECIVPGSNHRHDGTTAVEVRHGEQERKEEKKDAVDAEEPDVPRSAPSMDDGGGVGHGADGGDDVERPAGVKEVFMPALSSTMESGKVVQWLKREGERVSSGESVMVVESDKADMDVESFEDGVLAHIAVGEGESAPVGDAVAFLAPSEDELEAVRRWAVQSLGGGVGGAKSGGDGVSSPAAPATDAATETAAAAVAPTPQPSAAPADTERKVVNEGRIVASPYAKKRAKELGVDLRYVSGSGDEGRIVAKDVEAAAGDAPSSPSSPAPSDAPYRSAKKVATPEAKKLAKQERIDLAKVEGSGAFGRITADDVLRAAGKAPSTPKGPAAKEEAVTAAAPAAVEQKKDEAVPAAAAPKPAAPKPAAAPAAAGADLPDGAVVMNATQKGIAKNMSNTLAIPTFNISYDICTTRMDALMLRLKSKGVTVSSLLAKAVALALLQHPVMNARYERDTIVHKKQMDIAVAVATPDGGLVTPVLQKAEKVDIYSLSREWKALVKKALEKKLSMAEMSGAHVYLSNLGMYGVSSFQAILPEGAGTILAIGGAKPTVRLQESGLVGVEKVMSVTATCDHRVIMGADCAEFLKTLADLIENRIEEVLY